MLLEYSQNFSYLQNRTNPVSNRLFSFGYRNFCFNSKWSSDIFEVLSDPFGIFLFVYFGGRSNRNINQAVVNSHSVILCHDTGNHPRIRFHSQRRRDLDNSIIRGCEVQISISSEAASVFLYESNDFRFF